MPLQMTSLMLLMADFNSIMCTDCYVNRLRDVFCLQCAVRIIHDGKGLLNNESSHSVQQEHNTNVPIVQHEHNTNEPKVQHEHNTNVLHCFQDTE